MGLTSRLLWEIWEGHRKKTGNALDLVARQARRMEDRAASRRRRTGVVGVLRSGNGEQAIGSRPT
jgi:hypothetical protein